MSKFEDIMRQYWNGTLTDTQTRDKLNKAYKAGEITRDEANAGLKDLGAGYSFQTLTDEERASKKQREDELGFIPATEEGKPLPKTADMRRRPDLAGQVVRQHTRAGDFDVTYTDAGYAVSAKKVN